MSEVNAEPMKAKGISTVICSHYSRSRPARLRHQPMSGVRDGYCHKFQRGHCTRGGNCKYLHGWPAPGGYQSHLNPALAAAAPPPGATALQLVRQQRPKPMAQGARSGGESPRASGRGSGARDPWDGIVEPGAPQPLRQSAGGEPLRMKPPGPPLPVKAPPERDSMGRSCGR